MQALIPVAATAIWSPNLNGRFPPAYKNQSGKVKALYGLILLIFFGPTYLTALLPTPANTLRDGMLFAKAVLAHSHLHTGLVRTLYRVQEEELPDRKKKDNGQGSAEIFF